jgi:hypothetical protein
MPNFSGIWTVTQQMQATGQSIWPARPGAPTIGTATATGATTATVAFTAGSTGYPTTVTFTATSSPGGLTGTGSSSPVTVTGLTTGTAYTFTVTATNATGTSAASAASNSITPVLQPGDAFGGGYFMGQISTSGNGIANYNLVIGPKATAQSVLFFKTSNTGGDPTSVIDGPANSAAMNSATYPAAEFCEGLTVGGFTDWYLPAKNELEIGYYNLKPWGATNDTSSGINANAVPARASNYTSGSPAQTSVSIFRTSSSEAFNAGGYWSSSEAPNPQLAWAQDFYAGSQSYFAKAGGFRARAVRRVAV